MKSGSLSIRWDRQVILKPMVAMLSLQFSLTIARAETDCATFSVDYFPSQFTTATPFDRSKLKKFATCKFDLTSCQLDGTFSVKTANQRENESDSIILITRKSDKREIIVNRNRTIQVDGRLLNEVSVSKLHKVLAEIKTHGDDCTAKARYKKICLGRAIHRNFKEMCRQLKAGQLNGKSHIETN